ncbi:MAG: tetratricopeptide repeat protein [Ignavibacteriales bacterium]|nr:tetratricopeptide repeat protein [Ignavibacteriales bacterium]
MDFNVQYVLEGSVRKAGNNLRITAQLIDATNDAHLWAEKYSGTLDDVFEIQEKVSRSIVDALELKLTSDATKKIAEKAIDNVAAYEYYLKAYHEIWKFTEDALSRALDYLEKGLQIIGDNAFLYSAKAFAHFGFMSVGIKPEEHIEKAEKFAQKALVLNPDFPKALAVLGWIQYWNEHTQQGIHYFKRALAADPNEYAALHGLAATYFWAGKLEAALSFSERMIQIDPLNPLGHNLKGAIYFQIGQYEIALESFERAYQMDPDNRAVHFHYTWVLAGTKQIDKAISIIDQDAQTSPDNTFTKFGLLLKYGLLKDKEGVLQVMRSDFEKTCRENRGYSYMVANVFALLGEKGEALDWLEFKNLALFLIPVLSVVNIINAQDLTKLSVVYKIPGMEKIQVQRGITYKSTDSAKLTMDVYYPPDMKTNEKLPVVILVLGYSNNVFKTKLKDMEPYISWAELIAASGMVTITYETTQPASDVEDLITYVRQNASSLKIDENNIGIWSCSANVLTALSILSNERREYIKCAALYYGLMLTPDQKFRDSIKALTKQVNFSVEGIDRIKYLHKDLPLFIVRAGKDMEVFNKIIDYFVPMAVAESVPLTFVNHAEGRHGFDLYDDNDKSRNIIKETLSFLKFYLLEQENKR